MDQNIDLENVIKTIYHILDENDAIVITVKIIDAYASHMTSYISKIEDNNEKTKEIIELLNIIADLYNDGYISFEDALDIQQKIILYYRDEKNNVAYIKDQFTLIKQIKYFNLNPISTIYIALNSGYNINCGDPYYGTYAYSLIWHMGKSLDKNQVIDLD